MKVSFLYLFLASAFQLAWLYNMKRIRKGIWKELRSRPFFSPATFKTISPLLLYLVFSISNVVLLTMSMEEIPPSVAYAIWTGIVIGVAAVIDQVMAKKPMKISTVGFILLILLGIIGLRIATP